MSVLGVLYPYRCTDGGEIWHGGGDLWSPPPCQISSVIKCKCDNISETVQRGVVFTADH